MSDKEFNELKKCAVDFGLKLHPNIEHKTVDGIAGVFATQDIQAGEELCVFPRKHLLTPSQKFDYPDGVSSHLRYLHTAAQKIEQKDDMWHLACGREALDEFTAFHSVFYNQEELELLQKANPILCEYANVNTQKVKRGIQQVQSFDSSISEESLFHASLNIMTRAWGEFGIIPILDTFNHSELRGASIGANADSVYLYSIHNYAKGEQVFINYGRKDMFLHAVNYGYFDPNGHHIIDMGIRIKQLATSKFQKQSLSRLKSKFKVFEHPQQDGSIAYQLDHAQAMLFEHAPSLNAIDFIREVCCHSDAEYTNPEKMAALFPKRAMQYLTGLDKLNKSHEFKEADFPEKMRYFLRMLKKEKQML